MEDTQQNDQHDGKEKDQQEQRQQHKGDESKVKQVTFLETEKQDDSEKRKKVRKRMRKVMNQLRDQMEFYFGDANLRKDRFMKQHTEGDPEGYIPLSVFLEFNKIRELTDSQDLLSKALRSSQFLQVSADGSKVRRTTPVKQLTQEEIDARTVYIEGFHKFISREWIHSLFSRCGKVAYISLPRFKTSNEIKGFAFVEFETLEAAAKAVKELNRAPENMEGEPAEKVGGSMKQSKNLKVLKKQATQEGIDVEAVEASCKPAVTEGAEAMETKEVTKPKSKKRKKKSRSSQASEESKNTSASGGGSQQPTNQAGGKAQDISGDGTSKAEASGDTEDTKVKKSKKSKKKRKRKSTSGQQPPQGPTSAVSKSSEELDSTAQKPKQEDHTEGGESKASIRPGDADSIHDGQESKPAVESSESEGQSSRKRKRPTDGSPQHSAGKAAKVDSEQTDDSHGEGSKLIKSSTTGEEISSKKDCEGDAKDSTVGSETDPPKDSSRKRKTDTEDATRDKAPKVKKQKEGKIPGQPRRSLEQTSDSTAAGEGRKRKRKSVEGGEEVSRKKKKSNADSATEGEEEEVKKKRHRKHKRPGPQIRLRVMTKEEWARLKLEYLSQQKSNMKKLKEMLQEASRKRREQKLNVQNGEDDQNEKDNAKHAKVEFVADTVLEVKSVAGVCVQTIRADIAPSIELAYIDFKPGMTEGHIRCKDAESASKLLKTGLRGCSLSLVQGEAEQEYWAKLCRDREAKWANSKRPKKRGKHKLLQRAQNPQEETVQRQHLKFTDDDEENPDSSQLPAQMEDDFNAYSYHPNADSEDNASDRSMVSVDYEYDY